MYINIYDAHDILEAYIENRPLVAKITANEEFLKVGPKHSGTWSNKWSRTDFKLENNLYLPCHIHGYKVKIVKNWTFNN